MTLVQLTPIEIRELNLETFRLALKDLEDDPDGIQIVDTHRHNAPVTVGGVTLAQVVEIINGYTITFENGSYAVNIAGGNSNVADVVNFNLVAVRASNSAGLVQTREIESGAFGGMVYLDPIDGTSGTVYPQGTAQHPVNSLNDALLIAEIRGFKTIHVHNTVTVTTLHDISDYTIIGDDPHLSAVILAYGSLSTDAIFKKISVTGDLSAAGGVFDGCILEDITMFNGDCYNCVLKGTLYVVGSDSVSFKSCYDGVTGGAAIIDCGGTGRQITVYDYHGGLELQNKTGTEEFELNVSAGRIIIANTVTGNGELILRGVGELYSNLGTSPVDQSGLINPASGADAVFSKAIESGLSFQEAMKLVSAILMGKVSGADSNTITFRDVNDTKDRVISDVDGTGNRTAVTLDPS